MAEGFNTDDMLDMYLFENTQLLDNLQEIVMDQKAEERNLSYHAYHKGIFCDYDV